MRLDQQIDWPKRPTRWIEDRTLFVSVPFTWNLPPLRAELLQMDMHYERVVVGGPAVRLIGRVLDGLPDSITVTTKDHDGALQRVNPQATRTTIGCVNKCAFCAVPRIEPQWRELDVWPDLPVLMDNNLLAASLAHFDRVMDGLERHGWCDFNQGIDCRLLTDHHAERIGRVKGAIVRLALDSVRQCEAWGAAFDRLRRFGTAKGRIRSYVLCGHTTGPGDAWRRCGFVEAAGALALPQWFHELDALEENVVTEKQRALGWTDAERVRLMRHYYKHQGCGGAQ